MTAEIPGPSGDRRKDFWLILPTLVPPYEGVFEETYIDYLNDPERFRVALEYRVGLDNPTLLTFFDNDSDIPNPDLANKWLAVYYGMFDKAARKIGLPPLQVSKRVVDTYNRLGLLTSVNALETGDVFQTVQRINADWEKRRERDTAFSPELARFWQSVDQDLEMMRAQDDEYNEVGDILPVVSVQTVLQMQQDEFSLIEKYEL